MASQIILNVNQMNDLISDLDLRGYNSELYEYIEPLGVGLNPSMSLKSNIVFVNGEEIMNNTSSNAWFLGLFNRREKRKRMDEFTRRVQEGYRGIRIVAEGDSWFNYPKNPINNTDDVIKHLSNKHLIYSLAHGGDWLSNMVDKKEYIVPIRELQPNIFLMSGGGNDLLGKNRLSSFINEYNPEFQLMDFFKDEYRDALSDLRILYVTLFKHLSEEFPRLDIICHGYDYTVPKNDDWIGKPTHEKNIPHAKQVEIVRSMIDDFNSMIGEVSAGFAKVHYLDLRKTVISADSWLDELHPKSAGFELIANKFNKKIDDLNVSKPLFD